MTDLSADTRGEPDLAREDADRTARRRRLFVMPLLIVLVASAMWWWSNHERALRHEAIHDSVTAMVQGHLHDTSTAPTMMRLRWSEPAMQSVLLAGLDELGPTAQPPAIVVRSDLANEAGLTPVEINGESGSIVLTIQPMDDLQLGVIRSIARAQ